MRSERLFGFEIHWDFVESWNTFDLFDLLETDFVCLEQVNVRVDDEETKYCISVVFGIFSDENFSGKATFKADGWGNSRELKMLV